jgi:hypothetical protein
LTSAAAEALVMSLIDDIWRRNLAVEGTFIPRDEGTVGRRMANPVQRLADCIEAIGLVPAEDADAYRCASLPPLGRHS